LHQPFPGTMPRTLPVEFCITTEYRGKP